MKKTKRPLEEVALLNETAALLIQTLSKLDQRGTDEQIAKALFIVHASFDVVFKGKKQTCEQTYKKAMKCYEKCHPSS